MFNEKVIKGLICVLAIMLAAKCWAVAKEATQGTETKVVGTQTTEIEALGPTMAVSSVMQGLGRVGKTHKVLFIEVLEENYDTFLPGLGVMRDQEEPYFRFDKEKKGVIIDSRTLRAYSPNMLNAQGKIREDVSLIVKHTLDYKGIGRIWPKYYIYEVSQVPEIINLLKPPLSEHQEYYIRFVDDLKIIRLSSEGEIKFIYDKEKIILKPEESWKDKKRSKVIPIESDKYMKKQFDWFNRVMGIDKTIDWLKEAKGKGPFGRNIVEEDLEALKIGKVIFSTEVTIFNHGIVEIETYKRRSK